jgi:DNA-binding NtrC family response regulator
MGYNELAEDCLEYAMEVALSQEAAEAPLLYLELGRVRDLKGDWEGALHSYEKALGLPCDHCVDTGRILNGIGLQHYALGNWDKAAEYYTRASARSESPVGKYCAGVNFAVLLGERGKVQDALRIEQRLLEDLSGIEDDFGYYCVRSNMLYKYAAGGDDRQFNAVLEELTPVLERPLLRRLRFGVTDSRFVHALKGGRLDEVELLLTALRRQLGDGSAVSSPASEGWVSIREAMYLRACGQPGVALGRLRDALARLSWDALSRVTAEYEIALCLKETSSTVAADYALRAIARLKQLGFDRREVERRRAWLFERARRAVALPRAERGFEAFVGSSAAASRIRSALAKLAKVNATALILGESGTGKSFVAKLIHEASERRLGPFVRFDCTCHEEGLMESLLFGHRRGAFTGAIADRKGLVQLASAGTLLIDEVADLPLALQGKLLGLLEEGFYRPIGSTTEERASVRFLVATNKNLEIEVEEGRFREDLLFRVGALKVVIPPLRQRAEDIPDLVATFVKAQNARFATCKRLAASAWAVLTRQEWPGNVRQLQKVLERAIVLSEGDEIHVEDLGIEEAQKPEPAARTLEQVERDHILEVLASVSWNRSKAAKLLGIKRTTLYSRMATLGI